MAPPGLAHLRTSHDQNFVRCLGSGSLQTLRRPCGQLLRQRHSRSHQSLRRLLGQLLRQRQRFLMWTVYEMAVQNFLVQDFVTICDPVRRDGSGHRENCGELCDGCCGWRPPDSGAA